jgi:hypothetical protein
MFMCSTSVFRSVSLHQDIGTLTVYLCCARIIKETGKSSVSELSVHQKLKAVCFCNVVFVYSVKKFVYSVVVVQIHISDISHVTPLSENYRVQLKSLSISIEVMNNVHIIQEIFGVTLFVI